MILEKPSIDSSALHDVVLKAGETLNYTIPIHGAPKPKVTWAVGVKPVESSER